MAQPPAPHPSPNWFEALKRRKLVQWAAAYLAGAWLLLQLVALLAEIFAWPPVIARGLTVLLVVGFLVALVLAWYHGERGRQRVAGVELLMLAALLLLAAFSVSLVRGRSAPEPPHAAAADDDVPAAPARLDRSMLTVTRLTALDGLETLPAWSPDGRSIAYVSDQHGNPDIHVLDLASGSQLHLAESDAEDTQPAWSPDGRRIAFVSSRGRAARLDQSVQFGYSLGGSIWIAPAFGGPPERVVESGFDPAWSPDGRALAFDASLDGPRRIWRVELDGGEPMRVSADASGARVHTRPAWSPDGSWIAFQQHDGSNVGASGIGIVPASGGPAAAVVPVQGRNLSPEWLSDSTLVFSSDRGGALNLWLVHIDRASGAPRGEPVRLTTGTTSEVEPAVAPGRDTVAFSAVRLVDDLWSVAIDPAAGAATGEPRRVSSFAWNDLAPSLAPGGRRIALSSDRDGDFDVWTVGLDGADARPVARGAGNALQPVWSPDGATLAWFDDSGGDNDIHAAPAGGGSAVRLTDSPAQDINPYWSPDGTSIAFMSDRTGQLEVWIMDADGGRPRRVTSIGATGHTARWSPDGRWILFTSMSTGDREIWVVPADGGRALRITRSPVQDAHGLWSADGQHVYWLADHLVVWRVPFDTGTGEAGAPAKVWEPGHRIDYLHLAGDERTLLFTVPRAEGDVWLLGGLRSALDR